MGSIVERVPAAGRGLQGDQENGQTCIHRLIEAQVAAWPGRAAVVYEQRQLTYDQFNRRANQLAQHLQALGVSPETPVGVCAERAPSWLISLLAIWKAGGVYVPLDPSYPSDRLEFMIRDSGISILIAPRGALPVNHLPVVDVSVDWPNISRHDDDNLANQPLPHHAAYLLYTSGSTSAASL